MTRTSPRRPRTSRLLAAGVSRDGDRVTTLELFFDLVFVFAFRQVSEIVLHDPSGLGLLQGLVTLALVWWSWCSYAWLANQSRAEDGVVRIGMIVAAAIMFIVALAIPEAWHDLAGGLSGPLVFVTGYVLVRLVHTIVYVIAAGTDVELRRQIIVSMASGLLPAAVLLVVGALLGDPAQLWLWLAAIVVDLVLVYLASRAGNSWRLRSASHFAERFGLIVILALGESVIAIGAVAARVPIDWNVLGAALLAIAVAIGLWWAYFHRLAAASERELARRSDARRAALAVDGYTYLHFPIVAGIVALAIGIDEAMIEVDSGHPLGWTTAAYLGAGTALYLGGTVLFRLRASGEWSIARTVAVAVLLALIPALAGVTPIAGLGVVAAVVAALLAVEQLRRGRAAVPVAASAVETSGADAPADEASV